MKKRLIELQMFAEVGTGGNTAPTTTTPTEPVQEPKPEAKPAAKPEAKYTDDDVNKIIDKKFAEWQTKQQRAVDEAAKLAEMNAQEKAEYELQKERDSHAATQKKLEALERKDALAEMTKTARKMLADADINVSDDLLARLVTTDAEETKAAVDGFAKLFKDAVEGAVKARLKGEPPRVGSAPAAPVSEIEKRIKKYE